MNAILFGFSLYDYKKLELARLSVLEPPPRIEKHQRFYHKETIICIKKFHEFTENGGIYNNTLIDM